MSSASASFLGFDVMAPNRPALCRRSNSMVRSGSALPSLLQHSQPMSACTYSAAKPAASSTRIASGSTWLPMPSPGMVTTVCFAMIACSCSVVLHPRIIVSLPSNSVVILSGAPALPFRPAAFAGRTGAESKDPLFVPSLRDSYPFLAAYPALARWAKLIRPCGARVFPEADLALNPDMSLGNKPSVVTLSGGGPFVAAGVEPHPSLYSYIV